MSLPETQPLTHRGVTLVVDVDGTLLKTDLLWEGLALIVTRRPGHIVAAAGAVLRGKAALKAFVAEHADIAVDHLPLSSPALELIERAKESGSEIVLASGSHVTLVEAIARRVGAHRSHGTQGVDNLTGHAKLTLIGEHYDEFDYVGNSRADIPLWRRARRAVALNAGFLTQRLARRARPDLIVMSEPESRWRSWVRALRPHHWAKNALLFLPALAAHLTPTPALALRLIAGFLAFSALASAVYLFNDVADLASDRVHPEKRSRPLAAGEIPIPHAIAAAVVLVGFSGALATQLPTDFALALAAYLIITSGYSLTLKQVPVIDVITLASLYTVRIVAGAGLAQVSLSRWFLAFAIFLFFSLALIKRAVELRRAQERQEDALAGRGYRAEDLPVVTTTGTAAAGASALVYCLYITGDDVLRLYSNPDFLWAGLPIFLFWITRLWLLTGRGELHEDPVAFALKDPATYATLVLFMLTVWISA